MTGVSDPLFLPLQIGKVKIPNRILMAPMTRNLSPNGVPASFMGDYYTRRAAGGVGLIVTEGIGVDHPTAVGAAGLAECAIPNLHSAKALTEWKKIVDSVHQKGGIIFPQLWHQGVLRIDGTGPFPEIPSSRPSGVWGPTEFCEYFDTAHLDKVRIPTVAMSDSDIQDVIDGFVRSAENAIKIGFDGIALHGAHGYLLDAFLWKETNLRTDQYGGDITRRTRFATEVVRAIRSVIGNAPIMYRFSQWKLHDFNAILAANSHELEMVLEPLADAGVDIFDASQRGFKRRAFENSSLTLAGWAKKITGKITVSVGGVGLDSSLQDTMAGFSAPADNIDSVRTMLNDGEIDLIGVGRALLADPNWALKVKRGEPWVPFEKRHFFTKI